MLKNFEHIGMTVSDMDLSIAFYEGLLGLKVLLRKPAKGGGAELAFLDAGGGQLEIVAPGGEITPAQDSPPTQAGMRHMTFTYDDINEVFDRLVAAGVTIVEKPREAFNKEILAKVAFVRDPDGIMVELAER